MTCGLRKGTRRSPLPLQGSEKSFRMKLIFFFFYFNFCTVCRLRNNIHALWLIFEYRINFFHQDSFKLEWNSTLLILFSISIYLWFGICDLKCSMYDEQITILQFFQLNNFTILQLYNCTIVQLYSCRNLTVLHCVTLTIQCGSKCMSSAEVKSLFHIHRRLHRLI